ncbi:MAG: RagB/SusD family nutrient uptake outer membrane protein [Prevotella sp.]
MKKINILTAGLLLGAMTLTGCAESFLEQDPETKAPADIYFRTEQHITELLVGCYVPIHSYDYDGSMFGQLNWSDMLGDDMLVGAASITDQKVWHDAQSFRLTSALTLTNFWSVSYDGIRACNDVIDAVNKSLETNSISEAYAKKTVAEAEALRAFYYTIVWKWYGNIPYFTAPIPRGEYVNQVDHDAAYELIITDLQKAIDSQQLPMKAESGEEGHMTLAAAYMTYAELVMYQNDESRFPTALQYMQNIISGPYDLNPSYANLWSPDGEWCIESIFEINYTDGPLCVRSYDNLNGIGGTFMPQCIGPDGGVESDGDVANNGWGTFIPRAHCRDFYARNDVRGAVTLLDDAPKNPTGRWQQTNLFMNKYLPRYSHVASGTGGADQCRWNDNFRIYRFAETLLNAAELIVRTNGDLGLAKRYITRVRQRAGLVSEVEPTLDNILTERRYEFLGEGKRYWDLVRMEDVAGVQQKASALLVIDKEPVNSNGDMARTANWTKNKKYIPISERELSAGQGSLKQNDEYFQ